MSRGLDAPRRGLAILSVLAAMALVVLDANIVNVALPAIGGSLGARPSTVIAVVTAYQAALFMALLPMGALGERLGYRPVFCGGIALFAGASALCAVAPSLAWLVCARFVQGLGGAAVMALGVALLRSSVGEARLGRAIGWNALTVALASAAGPALGALVLGAADWRWIFAAGIPVGAVALIASRALPGAAGSGRRLLPFDLLRSLPFSLSLIASVCCFAGQTAALLALPFFLLHGLGQTSAATGLYMSAWPLSVAVMAPFAGRLADRVPTGWLCAAGAGLLGAGLAATAAWPFGNDPDPVIVCAVAAGAGFGLFQTANNRNIFLSAAADRGGAAGALQGTARLSGQIVGSLLVAGLFSTASMLAAPRIAFAVGAALVLVAGLVSLARTGRPA